MKHPVFDAHLSSEALEAHIRDLSALPARGDRRPPALEDALRKLRRAFMRIAQHARDGEELLAASAWVLDNYPFLEEEMVDAARELRKLRPLPALATGEVRAYRLVREAVAHNDAAIDLAVLASCAKAYLSLRSLHMRELWALPPLAAVAVLHSAAHIAADAASAQEDRIRAEDYAERLTRGENARLPAEDLRNPSVIERICARLREEDAGNGIALLDEQLRALDVDRDKMVAAAHRRQALWQLRIANCIHSLRALKSPNWHKEFEELSGVEILLRSERSGVYPRMDFASRDAVRREVERFAQGHACSEEQVARTARALADASSGREAHVGYYLLSEGRRALSAKLRSARVSLRLRLFAERHAKGLYMSIVWLISWIIPALVLPFQGPLAALLSNLPATAFAQRWTALLARKVFRPRLLLKMDYEEGIPKDAATAVVMPVLLTSPGQALAQVRQLEVYRLANRTENLSFLLLTDFVDHDAPYKEGDEEILQAAKQGIEDLRARYGPVFGILHRPRVWNKGQGRYMGRERKRGALEDLNALMLGGGEDAFHLAILPDALLETPFVLTVDADTVLPPGCAAKMAGAIAHPMNRRGEDGRGYGVLAPRVESLPDRAMTRFQRLYSGRLGLDIYGAAASETYQDLFGEGIYSGKGIYDVKAFSSALKGKIPGNAVLSHDLLEGLYAHAALVSDVTLYDAQPRTLGSWASRLHRWTRGDWQLVPFLFRKDIDSLGKWKLADNMRRSLTPAATILCILFGSPLFVPLSLYMLFGVPRTAMDWASALTKICFLPYEAKTQIDAACRALWRTFVSHKRRLDWVTAAQADQRVGDCVPWRRMFINPLTAVVSLLSTSPWMAALWLPAPFLAKWLEGPAYPNEELTQEQRDFLTKLAGSTYGWFENRASHEDRFLPSDNVQYKPHRGAAHRTSPTNIGLCLAADVAARDLGMIDGDEMLARIARRLDSIEKLATWNGHLYNWYSTQTLEPLHPLYVSSVDSGNYAACLWAASAAAMEVEGDAARAVAARLDALSAAIDFRALYDRGRRLFYIGYDTENEKMSASHYDLMASEARLTSIVAIAKGDVSARHYAATGRPLTRVNSRSTLLSWSGTMFEYLMPRLFLKDQPGTLLDETAKGAVTAQIEAAKGRPWGESESGYYAFDLDLNYQYRAFGVPALSMRGGLPGETVIAPYASMLALMVYPGAACENLMRMEREGYLGDEGFFEAVDYTPERVPEGQGSALVCSTMAHHQGMGLLALEAALGGKFLERFAKLPAIRSCEALLTERAPDRYIPARTRPVREHKPRVFSDRRVGRTAREGEMHLLSGGGTTLALGTDATGYLVHDGIMLTRFRSAQDGPFGVLLYLKDAQSGETTRIGNGDCNVRFEGGRAIYTTAFGDLDVKLYAAVTPEDGAAVFSVELLGRGVKERNIEVTCYLEPVLALQRADNAHRAYMDLFLEARTAQQGMLLYRRRPRARTENARLLAIVTGGDGEALGNETSRMQFLGRRGDAEAPIGLGMTWTEEPPGEWRAPIEPCSAMRRGVRVAPGKTSGLHFALLSGEREDALLSQAGMYSSADGAARAFAMAATRAQVELQYLGLTSGRIRTCERIAYILTYPQRLRTAEQDEATQRLRLGQSELWRFGISGDMPIMLVRVANTDQCAIARQMASIHEYLRLKGVYADLVLLNDYGNDYHQPVRERLDDIVRSTHLRALIGREGGAFVLNAADMTALQIDLVIARSCLYIDGGAKEIDEQLPVARAVKPEAAPKAAPRYPSIELSPIPTTLDNGYGGFAEGGREYLIYRRPPAPWVNVIANPHFGTMVSDNGFGYTWVENSRENKLTPWCNDPVREWKGEGLEVRDEQTGLAFSIDERCRHGQGYSVLESGAQGLLCEATVFVDKWETVKCTSVRILNPGAAARRLSLDAHALWTLSADRDESAPLVSTGRDGDILWARNGYGGEGIAYLTVLGARVAGFTCDAAELKSASRLRALSGRVSGADPCALVRAVVEIPAGGEVSVHFLLGSARDTEDARRMAEGFDPARSLKEVRAMWDDLLGRIEIKTPNEGLNVMMNRWMPYQALSSRLWGRTAFYQAGGAYGFRDQLQDAAMLAFYDPDILKQQILRCAAHQFEQGDVQHWWHEPRRGVRTRIRDDMAFLPWAVAHYVKLTGDRTILEESVRFLDAPMLAPGQEDNYGTPALGGEGTIMEHCLRALQMVLKFGEHGLPLIGGGDWNDAMNRVGIEGRGESVWLGWFLCSVLEDFAPLCDEESAAGMLTVRARIAEAIETHGWDGAWYRRAYFDDGTPMGASGSACCEIDLIAQAWSAISGAGDPARAKIAMGQAIDRLYDPAAGILKLLDPPFDGLGPDAGYIAGYVKGVRENGGQYTHGAAWGALALAKLGDGDACWKVLRSLLPVFKDPVVYRVEPYVAAADVYAGDNAGRGGWTWYTGSAAWIWRAAVEGLLGLRVEEGKANLSPCLPQEWSARLRWHGKEMDANKQDKE